MTSRKHRPWHRRLSRDWQRQGVLENCEVHFPVCVGREGLAPAHSKDREDIHTEQDFREVVAACAKCHWALDREMSKEDRLRIVKEIIANRDTAVSA